MTVFCIGCGKSAEYWFNHPHDVSIGVNDAIKHGKDTDYLILIDSLQGFKKEPDRVKLIGKSKAKILTNGDTWRSIFKNYERLHLRPFGKYLKKGHVYCSKSSPFVALSYAFNLGATDIVMFGVDMRNHKLFNDGSRLQQYELRNIEKICRMMAEQGTRVWVSSKESALSKFLNVWGPAEKALAEINKGRNDTPEYHTGLAKELISRDLWECEFGCPPEICRRPYGHCGRQI
jgi:hypothetical protein